MCSSNYFEIPDLYCPIILKHLICAVQYFWSTWYVLSNHFETPDLYSSKWLDNTDQMLHNDWTTQIKCFKLSGQHRSDASKWLDNTDQVLQTDWTIQAPDLCCPIILYTISYLLLVLFLSMQIVLFCSIAFKLIVCLCLMFVLDNDFFYRREREALYIMNYNPFQFG
jgi:hypothetical protein